VSSRSLVLIDELGRATSTADGVGLCWAFSEYLLAVGCHVLLATHFRQLEDLPTLYPSCKLWRMQVLLLACRLAAPIVGMDVICDVMLMARLKAMQNLTVCMMM
jgi:DNA mismatch repair ATPase MutS